MDEDQLVSPQQKQVQLCPPGRDRLLWDPSESGQRKGGHCKLLVVAVRENYFTLAPTAKNNSQGLAKEEVCSCALNPVQLQTPL